MNLVIWEKVFEQYAALARTLPCLDVTGNLQVGEGVVHLVTEAVWDPRLEDGSLRLSAGDFGEGSGIALSIPPISDQISVH